MLRRQTNESWTDSRRKCDEEACRAKRMGAEKNVRLWLVGRTEVSRRRQGRGHGEAQAVPLSVLEGNQPSDPRGFGERKGTFGGSNWEEKSLVSPTVGVGKTQELGNASRRLPGPRCCRRLFVSFGHGAHVSGQWCSRIRWGQGVGCAVLGMLNLRNNAPSRGLS